MSAGAVLRVLVVLIAIVALASSRVIAGGEIAIERGTEALEAGDVDSAIAHSEEAASWYAPGAPHVRVAYARLRAIADEAERRRDRGSALAAHRAILAASEQTRWLLVPHESEAQESRIAIARIESTGPRPESRADEPAQVIEQAQLAAMARELGPRRPFVVLLVLAFGCLIAGVVLSIVKAVDETGRLDPARARAPLALATLGLAGYVAALLLA